MSLVHRQNTRVHVSLSRGTTCTHLCHPIRSRYTRPIPPEHTTPADTWKHLTCNALCHTPFTSLYLHMTLHSVLLGGGGYIVTPICLCLSFVHSFDIRIPFYHSFNGLATSLCSREMSFFYVVTTIFIWECYFIKCQQCR